MSWACASCATVNEMGEASCAVCGEGRQASPVAQVPAVDPTVVAPSNAEPGQSGFANPSLTLPPSGPARVQAPPGTESRSAVPTASVLSAPHPAATEVRSAKRPTGMVVAAVAALVAVAVLAGLAAFVLTDDGPGGSERVRSEAETPPPSDDGLDGEEDLGSASVNRDRTADGVEPAVVEASTTPNRSFGEASRPATLYSGDAKIRSSPDLGGAEVTRISDRDGAAMEVIGRMDANGWYRVRLDGTEGYLFGAFVAPPDDGWCVGEMGAGSPIYVDDGSTIGSDENPSGPKMLMSYGDEIEGFLVAVLLADGRHGTIEIDTFNIEACGETR